ncbi:hypothetical protein RJ639_018706 [Escallonia herrerae]|uniref:RNA helicase n=1 Tax=Escallonia herrerae TaxID=1293975 RepID=A0AA89AJJ8_9ASTE|nr:hypothetical protein RJ639_018706 [Escallonia herrerae]
MEPCMDLECGTGLLSLKGDDSNAIILPGKKRNKKKERRQASKKLNASKTPELSKSDKKRLKKIEEEKEKALLLAKSIETLEKYKIGEDAYSLMWSSRNLGQVETVLEKRRREVQFLKVGLDLPRGDRPFKRRLAENLPSVLESDSSRLQPREECIPNESLPLLGERKSVHDASVSLGYSGELIFDERLGSGGGAEATMSVKVAANQDTHTFISENTCNSLSTYGCNDRKLEAPMVGFHFYYALKEYLGLQFMIVLYVYVYILYYLRVICILPSNDWVWGCMAQDTADESAKVNSSSMSNLANFPPHKVHTVPTVVHVSRPKELENKRRDLPIVMMEQEIMEAISENISVIICGETGCGKTTQVPQFLYEAGFGSKQCSVKSGVIGVTQPRRVAVLATAKRVAFELGLRLGKEVGFQVRHDRRIGDNSSIKFMTDGILLRELQSDFLLKRYSIIILDEAHERSLNTDILIGLLSRVLQERKKICEQQQKYEDLSGKKISPENKILPLKLVLMSATLRVEDFVSGRRIFTNPPPVIEVPTRQYPVTIHFSKKTEIVDYVGQAYKKVLSIHKRLPSGGILVFVTGQREVEYLCRKLRKTSRGIVDSCSKGKNEVLMTSGGLASEEYDVKEINEAFETQGNSSHQQTDRFSSDDGDHDDITEVESGSSSDSEEDSDLEVFGDGEDFLNQKNLESDATLADGNFDSLKAAFLALAGKNTLDPPSGDSNQSNRNVGNKVEGSKAPSSHTMHVLPLYAMLPASAQLRIFEEVKEGERLVVVATNVAETSLTIPGIKYVVDTGREKVKNYNSSNGIETYEVQWISKASAAQRAGRAGRTGPGHCYRLYSSAVFSHIFPDFSSAEILKVPVDGVVLLLKSMGIDKVANFPFPTPPSVSGLVEAERCLKVLEALDSKGRLTALGKAMSHYPMSPRHSRMLLTVIQVMENGKGYPQPNLILGYAVAAAAALSLSNPLVMQFEGSHDDTTGINKDENSGKLNLEKVPDRDEKLRKKKAKETIKVFREKFSNPTSDALTIAYALQCFERSESQVDFCNDNSLHLKTMEEMSKLRLLLLNLVFIQTSRDSQQEFSWTHGTREDVESAWRGCSDDRHLSLNEEMLLRQSICAGWADRVAKLIRGHSLVSEGDRKSNAVCYESCMVTEKVFLHRWSSVAPSSPKFLVYSELLHTKRPYIHGATSVKAEWLVKYAGSLCSFSALEDPKPYYEPVTDQVFSWVAPTFSDRLWKLPLHSVPIKDDKHRVAVFAFSLLAGQILPCLKLVQRFMAASPTSILRPEASGHKRVGNLLSGLKTRWRTIDSCSKLKEVWNDNPEELYLVIRDWFQEGFHDQFEELWAEMHHEVLLDPQERFSKTVKRKKKHRK